MHSGRHDHHRHPSKGASCVPASATGYALRQSRNAGFSSCLSRFLTLNVARQARLIRILTPWVSYVVLPLFALSNLRIHFSPDLLSDILHSNLAIGIIAGLAVGKPVGFLFATWLACRLHLARLPEGLTWKMVLGIGGVAGIGFTISLFIAELAFANETQFEEASLGVFAASVLSGLFGYAVFRSVPTKR